MALFGHKLCDICNKNRATIKYSRVDEDQVTSMLICQSCASEHSPLHKKSDAVESIQSLFSNLLKEKEGEQAARVENAAGVCKQCGLAFETYRKTFLLGCPGCYESFADPLLIDLRKIHGEVRHLGKVPQGQAREIRQQVTMESLRQQLLEAIEREDFEAAAAIRDQIRAQEQREGQG